MIFQIHEIFMTKAFGCGGNYVPRQQGSIAVHVITKSGGGGVYSVLSALIWYTGMVPLPLTSRSPSVSPLKVAEILFQTSWVRATLPSAALDAIRAATLTVSPQISN